MDFGIAGKTALLLSSTRGLGFGCAEALVAEGVHVVINGRNAERGIDAISRLGETAHFVQADITKPSERARLFEEARAYLGTISILVTNADGPPPGSFMSKSNEDWQAAFELIMLSALDMVKRCLPEMIERGYGRIVNISSTSAKETTPGAALGDVDGDGDLDLLAGNRNQANRLYLNNGTASPFSGVSGSNVSIDTYATRSVALGDVDGDGDLDLLAGNYNQANRLYLNNGTASPFSGVRGSDVSADTRATYSVALGDVDGDGDLDNV